MIATAQFTISIVNDGVGIVENIIEYCISSSGTIVPGSPLTDGVGNIIYDINGLILTDGAWSTSIPISSDGDYIWTRSKTVYSDGKFALAYMVSHHGEDGAVGATGVSVVNVIPEFRLSDSSNSITGSGAGYAWSTNKPKVESGQYIWERQRNELSDGTVVYSDATCDITMSGVVVDVDQNKKAIAQKVWATDITNSINQYDSSTTQTIRDRVSQTETDIAGITSTVSDVQSTLSTKADGSTVTALQNTVTQNKQTADAFQQTVQSTYAKLTDVDDKIDDIKIGGHNLYVIADEVPGYLHASNGTIQTQSATKEVTSFYIPVKEGENYIIQSWATPSTTGGSWLAYQFFTNNTGTPKTNREAKYGSDTNSGVETTAEGLEHLTYDVKVPTGAKYIRVSYRKFNDGYAMVEKATKPSEYAINPKDLEQYADDVVESAKSEIKQTTDNISLEVSRKVGTSEVISKINQSPESITIDASKVNLIGAVTFNMLDSAAQSRITSVENTASSANSWITTNGNTVLTAKNIVNNWATDATSATTTIKGGLIQTHTILAEALATNAVMSTNYSSGVQDSDVPSGYYSTSGSFLDLATGNFYTPNFSVVSGNVYVNGEVNMLSGQIGDVGNSYWEVGTKYGEDWSDKAAIIAHGNALIQTGQFTLEGDKLSSFNNGDYVHVGNEWYDYAIQVPDRSATGQNAILKNDFLYIRKIGSEPDEGTMAQDWTYLFKVDKDGNVYENGTKLSDKYATISDVGSAYLPTTGGTVNGNVTITGTLTATASAATKLANARNLNVNLSTTTNSGKVTFDGSADKTLGVTGTLGVGNGGTGKSSWTQWGIIYASATNTLAQIGAGTSGQILKSNGSAAPTWIDQSTLSVASAVSATQDASGNVITTTYRRLDDGDFDAIDVVDLDVGNLIVTRAARFTNGLYGDLVGNVTGDISGSAGSVANNLKIQLNGGTTEGTNQFTYNGSAVKNINITKSSVGLGNVENTALSTWAGSSNLTTTSVGTLGAAATKAVDSSISASSTSTNLPTSSAVAAFVEGRGYVTSSGVTSVRVQATSPVVSSTNTEQTSTLNTTISLANAYGDTKNPYGNKTANYVLAGPSSGSAAAPTFRALVAADIPSITKSKISDFPTTWSLANITGADDLQSIEGLSGTSGILKKTAANAWTLTTVVSGLTVTGDNNDVLTVTKSDGSTQDLSINITGQVVSGATILTDSEGVGVSVGSASKPVYFSSGVPVAGNDIPVITLNNSATTSPSFYAPTGAGSSGQYLKSNGSGAPSWATFSKSTVGLGNVDNTADANKNVLTATKFSSARTITLTGDVTGSASSDGTNGWSITTTVGNATNDSDGNAINTTYLKLSGGTMTGGITLPSDSSGWNTKGIIFSQGSRIGENTSGGLGIYAAEKLYLRPNSGTAASSTDGVVIDGTGLYPSVTNTENLGGTSNKWANVYATTFNGALSGNASTATSWASAQKVYVTLGTASTTTTIQGGSSTAQTIGVNGTLGVGNGGTGKTSWTQYGIVYASAANTLAQLGIGTSGKILKSNGSAAPSWVNQSDIAAGSAVTDGSGNTITSYYVTLSTAQTISGAKTFSAVTDFTNTTASTSKSTGAVKVSGGVGVAGRMSANETMIGDHVVLSYNTTTESLDFIFS